MCVDIVPPEYKPDIETNVWEMYLYVWCIALHVMHRSTVSDARVPCAKSTRDELRALKRGDIITYDELFRSMIDQYDPEQAGQATEK